MNDEQISFFACSVQELEEIGLCWRGKSAGIDRREIAGRTVGHCVVSIAGGIGDKQRRSERNREPVGPVACQQLFFEQVRIVLQIAVEVVFVVVVENKLTGNKRQLEGAVAFLDRRRSLALLAIADRFPS